MSQPALHLVGGFLGSGKTTAIIHAAKALMAQCCRVGVVTNDQGRYLVDTAFFRLADVPAVEVTGGCFCCNYDDLGGRLAQLVEAMQPEIIFAESVGSCADIVATVVRPLLELGGTIRPSSFSVFTDARLLRRRLLGHDLPFSDDVVYIFDKQIEEAGLLVVNKIDLVDGVSLLELNGLLAERYPGKPALLQSSLNEAGVRPWLARIQAGGLVLPNATLQIDYDRYGAGEAQLAWLDEQLVVDLPDGDARARLAGLLEQIRAEIARRGAGIGHVKFIIQAGAVGFKLSFTTLDDPGWKSQLPALPGGRAEVLVNARVEMPAEELQALLRGIVDQSGLAWREESVEAFHPGMPKPAHRIG